MLTNSSKQRGFSPVNGAIQEGSDAVITPGTIEIIPQHDDYEPPSGRSTGRSLSTAFPWPTNDFFARPPADDEEVIVYTGDPDTLLATLHEARQS
ncbi:hypothetical protein GCM10009864_81680 [Streptomyces lunalinharesii]|uniref:Uncharacterized protein n=1 Tax=Streptomyces lunalinharesii TaxID=333384 RepID=A0ABN3T843_9ACTN